MKFYSYEQQSELLKIALEKYNNRYACDNYGRFPWDCERRGLDQDKMKTVSLTKAGLGKFVYEVLIRGGNITEFYVFSISQGGAVFPRVWLTMEARDDMIEKTGYCLNAPPTARLN